MDNIIRAIFTDENVVSVDATQWDYGRVLQIEGIKDLPSSIQVHFSLYGSDDVVTYVGTVSNDVLSVAIPDSLLQDGSTINAYIYYTTTQYGYTVKKVNINVKRRPQPSDIEAPTTSEQTTLGNIVSSLNQKADGIGYNSTTDILTLYSGETVLDTVYIDTTIESSEISNALGYVPASVSQIPTKLSQLSNDSNYVITETDPTVPSWAKASSKPSYTAAEVGALPSTTIIPTRISQLGEDSAHRTVTDADKIAWNSKPNLSDIPNTISQLTEDDNHKTVKSSDITKWNNIADNFESLVNALIDAKLQ